MRKAAIGIMLLLVLTGCWDRLPLRDLQMIDIISLDREKDKGSISLDLVVTTLKRTGKGEGEPISERTTLKGASVIEAVGQADYLDQGPFLAVNTRAFLFSESFASHQPVEQTKFLLHSPYTSVNAPIIIFIGDIDELVKFKTNSRIAPVEKLETFISSLESNGVMKNVSMMQFITSQQEQLEDFPLPLVRYKDKMFQLEGAMLFHAGTLAGGPLTTEQVRMLMFMEGVNSGRQKIAGRLSDNDVTYGFSVKTVRNSFHVKHVSGRTLQVDVNVQLDINVFEIGENIETLSPQYASKMQQSIGKQFDRQAAETIKVLQKANCDPLGIGMHLRAYHPKLWRSMEWRKDYPNLTIKPNFEVRILN